ncbi:MAG: c-type cytochrome [Rhodothermales bacterium]|nr:c-type cytochrome [Rhodothermales bacterium]MBO6778293.1 c-type cytochrome [Rhodothermales bacterium]
MLRLLLAAVLVAPLAIPAQAQRTPQNLQVLPRDWSRGQVISLMRQFSFGTGLRCEGCHYDPVGEGNFQDIDFASDENPLKEKARFMIRMTRNLNDAILPMVPNRDDPPVVITCKTCHRGVAKPRTLMQELLLTAHESGGDSAATQYRDLRESSGMAGVYDFREWETNEVASQLAEAGKVDDAIVIYELNAEFHPESSSIQLALGQLYEGKGDVEAAIAAYERAIELGAPANRVQPRIDDLRGDN